MKDQWLIFGRATDDVDYASITFVGTPKEDPTELPIHTFVLDADQLRRLYLEAGWQLQAMDRGADEIARLREADPA